MVTKTYKLIMAAAQDAGNRRMHAAGRWVWDESDFEFAAAEFARLSVEQHRKLAAARLTELQSGA